jgi:hypothetical protein
MIPSSPIWGKSGTKTSPHHYATAWESSQQGAYETFGIPNRYATGINWNEFHTPPHTPTKPTNTKTHFMTYNPITRNVEALIVR